MDRRKEIDDEIVNLLTKMREQSKKMKQRDMTALENASKNLPIKTTVLSMNLVLEKMAPAVDTINTYYVNGIQKNLVNPDSNDMDCIFEDIRTLNSAIDVIDEYLELYDCMEKYMRKVYAVKEKSDAFILGRY